MAMGKPILAMLAGEGASIIKQANCGFIAPPSNALKLNEQIKNVLNTSKSERRSLGENGKTFYKKNFSSKIRKKERLKYKIDDSATVLLYLGRINMDKGIKELIDSYSLLNRQDCFLFLVGPIEIDIKKLTIKKDLSRRIIYLPFTNKPQEILQLCDVFCFPSHREGFGYSIIEASALEKPVICSDIYGLK